MESQNEQPSTRTPGEWTLYQEPASVLACIWPGDFLGKEPAAVTNKERAHAIMGCALVWLHEQGLIRMKAEHTKKLGIISWDTVPIAPLGHRDLAGIEGGLLAAIDGHREVKAAVSAWFPSDQVNPWDWVVSAASRHAYQLGLYEEVVEERHGIARVLGKKTVFHPIEDRIAQVAPQVIQMAATMSAFHEADPDTMKTMYAQIAGAIAGRQERQDTSNSDF